VVSTQYIVPSFARFLISPRQTFPCEIVCHSPRDEFLGMMPELMIR